MGGSVRSSPRGGGGGGGGGGYFLISLFWGCQPAQQEVVLSLKRQSTSWI